MPLGIFSDLFLFLQNIFRTLHSLSRKSFAGPPLRPHSGPSLSCLPSTSPTKPCVPPQPRSTCPLALPLLSIRLHFSHTKQSRIRHTPTLVPKRPVHFYNYFRILDEPAISLATVRIITVTTNNIVLGHPVQITA